MKFKRFSAKYMLLLVVIDLLIVLFSFWLGMELRPILPFGRDLSNVEIPLSSLEPDPRLYAIAGFIWMLIFNFGMVYTPHKILFWNEEYQRIAVAHTVAALCLIGLFYLFRIDLSRLAYIYFCCISLLCFFAYRSIFRYWHRLRLAEKDQISRILIIGAGETGQKFATTLKERRWLDHQVVGFLDDIKVSINNSRLDYPIIGTVEQVKEIVQMRDVDTVVIALPRQKHTLLAYIVEELQQLSLRISIVPDYFDLAFHNAKVDSIGDIPLIGLREPLPDGFQWLAKRVFDILISFIVLFFVSPIMVLIAASIKLEDGGPIFYKAQRVGQNRRLFNMLKFRSMYVDADKMQHIVNQTDADGNLIHKVSNDPRITRVGRFIRRTSLDELPQLYNVLIGDMSLVGPRPELPWLVDGYDTWQYKRFSVPQGITGWWQVTGRSDNPMHLNTELDLYYVQNYSLWLDLQILWRTIGVVMRGRGAY